MKTYLTLPSLYSHSKTYDLCLFHKLYSSNPALRGALFLELSYTLSRKDHQKKEGVPLCCTSSFNAFFFPRHLLIGPPAPKVPIPDGADFKILF